MGRPGAPENPGFAAFWLRCRRACESLSGGRIFLLFLLLGGPVSGADWAARRDPQLTALAEQLESILRAGRLPELELPPERQAALRDPRDGVAADYRAWQQHLAQYQRELAEFHGYRDLRTVTALTTQPISAAWRMEQWQRQIVAGPPGIDTALQQAQRLCREIAPGDHRKLAVPRSRNPLDDCVSALTRAAEAVDQRVLGGVSPADRRRVGEIIAWICRSGGRFAPRSKGSPW